MQKDQSIQVQIQLYLTTEGPLQLKVVLWGLGGLIIHDTHKALYNKRYSSIMFDIFVFLNRITGELYCTDDELSVSDSIKSRLMTDTANRLIIFDDVAFSCYGSVKSWIFYSTKNQEFKPGIYRLQTGNYFKLVGENTVPGSTSGYTEYEVPESERIRFQPGDLIGFRHANPSLNYDMGLDAAPFHYKDISDYSTVHTPGTVFDVSSTGDRGYSLQATFDDESKLKMKAVSMLDTVVETQDQFYYNLPHTYHLIEYGAWHYSKESDDLPFYQILPPTINVNGTARKGF